MGNPWKEISLSDYESHMSLDSVGQLQALNSAMKKQLSIYPVTSAMILGVAGGNGLDHVDISKYDKVYGVDINSSYLKETEARFPELSTVLECLCIDLVTETDHLPKAELLIANLLVEYIGYGTFQTVIRQVSPRFVSCVIQINEDEGYVSDSPYLHVFDRLDEVHHQMEAQELTESLIEVGYQQIDADEYPLPNGKKLIRLDYDIIPKDELY